MLRELAGELADRRRLSGPVHADDEDHARTCVEHELRGRSEDVLDLRDERVAEPARDAARLEPAHQLGGRGHADVAADERLLESLPRLVVRRVETRGRELGRQRLPTLGERVPHAGEEARSLGLVGRRDLVAEELGPGVAHAVAARACWCSGSRRDTTCDTPSGPIVTP